MAFYSLLQPMAFHIEIDEMLPRMCILFFIFCLSITHKIISCPLPLMLTSTNNVTTDSLLHTICLSYLNILLFSLTMTTVLMLLRFLLVITQILSMMLLWCGRHFSSISTYPTYYFSFRVYFLHGSCFSSVCSGLKITVLVYILDFTQINTVTYPILHYTKII